MNDSVVLGIDIGGSHLTAALVNEKTRHLVEGSRKRIRVDSKGSAAEIFEVWSNAITDIFDEHGIVKRKIGIAMPGPFDYKNGISHITGLDKYEALHNLNVKELLSIKSQVPIYHIRMMNDAASFLQGEVYAGAGQGYTDVIGITLGTGTGTAVHHQGITEDSNLGPSSFKDSVADEYFSTRWFIKRYAEITGVTVQDVKALAELYDSDQNVRDIFSEFVKNLAEFLEGFIKMEKPEAVVMGGNIAKCSDLFLADLERALHTAGIDIPILKAQLGEEAAILGAASLFGTKEN